METSNMVPKSISSHFTELDAVSRELNKLSDAFTGELKAVEAHLETLKIGIEVELQTPFRQEHPQEDDTGRSFTREYRLAYAKSDGRWRIVVREISRVEKRDEDGETYEDLVLSAEAPLTQASREILLSAAASIESLVKEITAATKRKVATLQRVTDRHD